MSDKIKASVITAICVILFVGAVVATEGIRDSASITRAAYQNEKLSHVSTTIHAVKCESIVDAQDEFIDILWDASIEGGTNLGCIYCHKNVLLYGRVR